MTDIVKYQTLERFTGINNVDDAVRLVPLVIDRAYAYPLQTASNVDIDNTLAILSRPGYDDVLSGSDIHSLWSDDVTCLFVDGTSLKRLTTGYTTETLRTVTVSARMSYAPNNDRIYYTNGHEIGYVKAAVSNELPDPGLDFKLPLPAGKFIEYFRGCLYVASGKILYISDPLCDFFDVRTGYKQFAADITLLRAVDDGIYVGDDKTWWLKGAGADDFERVEAYSRRPIPYTDVRVDGQNIGDGVKGKVAMWTADNGICLGDNSGSVINLTENRYVLTPTAQGAGFIRKNNNIYHYINSLF